MQIQAAAELCGCCQVVDAVCEAVGSGKVGIRLSPFGAFLEEEAPGALDVFKHLVGELNKRNLCYVHCIEARVGQVQNMLGAPAQTGSTAVHMIRVQH